MTILREQSSLWRLWSTRLCKTRHEIGLVLSLLSLSLRLKGSFLFGLRTAKDLWRKLFVDLEERNGKAPFFFLPATFYISWLIALPSQNIINDNKWTIHQDTKYSITTFSTITYVISDCTDPHRAPFNVKIKRTIVRTLPSTSLNSTPTPWLVVLSQSRSCHLSISNHIPRLMNY